jgi:hypothetical protein
MSIGREGAICMVFLIFMGDANEARNFSYCLEIGGNGWKLIWHGVPRSIREIITVKFMTVTNHDGLIIQRDMALFFLSGDIKELNLRLSGHILKE